MKSLKWLNLLAIIPIVLGVWYLRSQVAQRKSPEKKSEPEVSIRVQVQTVEEKTLPQVLRGFGTVVAERRWTAVPQVSGKVTSIHPNLRTGETVVQGSILVTIDTSDQRLEEARIQSENQVLQTEISQIESRKKQLQSTLKVAQSSLALLQKEEARYQNLFDSGAVSASTVDARHREVLQQQRVIEDIQTNLATLPAQVQGVRARMSVQNSNIEKQRLQVSRSVIRAPFTGRLGEVFLEVGQVVNTGAHLFTLEGREQLKIEAKFTPQQLLDFPVRRAAIILPDGTRYPAEIGPLGEKVEPNSRTASVQLLVSAGLAQDSPLLPGALVEVELIGADRAVHPVVPRLAVQNGQVFTVVDGRLQRKPVTIEFRQGDQVAISEGLRAGEKIVISDPGLAIDGSLVEVTEAPR